MLMDRKEAIRVLAGIAENQHGYITRQQARAAGVDHRALSRLAADGRMTNIDRGIWRFDPSPTWPTDSLYVAWLQLAPDRHGAERIGSDEPFGIVTGWTAAWMHGVVGIPDPEPYQFRVPRRYQGRGTDIVTRVQPTAPSDWADIDDLPVLRPGPLLADLARFGGDGGWVGCAVAHFLNAGTLTMAEACEAVHPERLKWGFRSPARLIDHYLAMAGLHVPKELLKV